MTTPEPTTLREALEAIAAEHHADPDGGMGYRDGGYGHMDSVCVLCGTSDEYGIPWPCETHEQARAALAAPPAAPFYCLNAEGHSGRHSGWVDGEWSVTDTPDNPVLHMPESVAPTPPAALDVERLLTAIQYEIASHGSLDLQRSPAWLRSAADRIAAAYQQEGEK